MCSLTFHQQRSASLEGVAVQGLGPGLVQAPRHTEPKVLSCCALVAVDSPVSVVLVLVVTLLLLMPLLFLPALSMTMALKPVEPKAPLAHVSGELSGSKADVGVVVVLLLVLLFLLASSMAVAFEPSEPKALSG